MLFKNISNVPHWAVTCVFPFFKKKKKQVHITKAASPPPPAASKPLTIIAWGKAASTEDVTSVSLCTSSGQITVQHHATLLFVPAEKEVMRALSLQGQELKCIVGQAGCY